MPQTGDGGRQSQSGSVGLADPRRDEDGDVLARSDSGSADRRLEAAIVQAEFMKRLEDFDEAQILAPGGCHRLSRVHEEAGSF